MTTTPPEGTSGQVPNVDPQNNSSSTVPQFQAPGTTTGTGTTTTGQVPETQSTDPSTAGPETFDRAYVEQLRRENAQRRTRERELEEQLNAFTAAQEEARRAELSEVERLQLENAESAAAAQASAEQATELEIRYAVATRAAAKGIVDIDAAVLLMDMDQLEFDSNGRVSNVDAVLDSLLTQRPYLKATPQVVPPTIGATNPASPRPTTLTVEDVKRMSPQEINARWAEVQAVLKSAQH